MTGELLDLQSTQHLPGIYLTVNILLTYAIYKQKT